jgi:transcriptional regulator with XRE-family HTH domain
MTQSELAEYVQLSLKYIGEIERGEANTTLEVLERLSRAVGWDPMETLDGLNDPLSEGVRVLLLEEVQQMVDRLRNMAKWLHALDPALQPPRPTPPPREPDPPKRVHRRGRAAQEAPKAAENTQRHHEDRGRNEARGQNEDRGQYEGRGQNQDQGRNEGQAQDEPGAESASPPASDSSE